MNFKEINFKSFESIISHQDRFVVSDSLKGGKSPSSLKCTNYSMVG